MLQAPKLNICFVLDLFYFTFNARESKMASGSHLWIVIICLNLCILYNGYRIWVLLFIENSFSYYKISKLVFEFCR